jgi:uncharacterized protein
MTVFADSYFYLAILSVDDEGHSRAIDFSRSYRGRTITTEWVLTEVADALASPRTRGSVPLLYQGLRNNPKVTIISAEHISFERGMDLYCNRPDKGWSLTDCISFEVMREHGVTEALTGDRHFAQARFTPVFAI